MNNSTDRWKKDIKLGIICSNGGHLLQFMQLRKWWCQYDRFWLTFDKPDVRYLLKGERVYWGYYPTTRNYKNLCRNFFKSLHVLLKERPYVIASTGAGIAIPAFYIAKCMGIKTIFIEAFNRINSPTVTGRVVRPVTDQFYVQWESQQRFYKKSRLLGRLL